MNSEAQPIYGVAKSVPIKVCSWQVLSLLTVTLLSFSSLCCLEDLVLEVVRLEGNYQASVLAVPSGGVEYKNQAIG